jgi:hypothetical protein
MKDFDCSKASGHWGCAYRDPVIGLDQLLNPEFTDAPLFFLNSRVYKLASRVSHRRIVIIEVITA